VLDYKMAEVAGGGAIKVATAGFLTLLLLQCYELDNQKQLTNYISLIDELDV
jgi:hypothetical protein